MHCVGPVSYYSFSGTVQKFMQHIFMLCMEYCTYVFLYFQASSCHEDKHNPSEITDSVLSIKVLSTIKLF